MPLKNITVHKRDIESQCTKRCENRILLTGLEKQNGSFSSRTKYWITCVRHPITHPKFQRSCTKRRIKHLGESRKPEKIFLFPFFFLSYQTQKSLFELCLQYQ